MKYSIFWDFSQRRLVICYRRLGTIFCPIFLDCLTLEYGTGSFSHNVDDELTIYAEKYPRRANISQSHDIYVQYNSSRTVSVCVSLCSSYNFSENTAAWKVGTSFTIIMRYPVPNKLKIGPCGFYLVELWVKIYAKPHSKDVPRSEYLTVL